MSGLSYKQSGVDLEIYAESMKRLPRLMHRTFSPRVQQLDGGFAGLFQLDFEGQLFRRNYQNPVMVACTDGVGTKLKVAQGMGRHDSVGIDLVAMCVNDAICCGAEPLFFLDYVAMGKDDPEMLEQIVSGISNGCVMADCALLGGETAIMPDLYRADEYDLAGFCVGVVEKQNLIDGRSIVPEDIVIGVASTGVHSNGYSLVRKIVYEAAGKSNDEPFDEATTIGETLLRPTAIYVRAVRDALQNYKVKNVIHGIAHITGGGLVENIGRILPANVSAEIDAERWTRPPVFDWLQKLGSVETDEMYRVFNMGIGLAVIVSPFYAESVRRTLALRGAEAWMIGKISEGEKRVSIRNK